MLANKFSGVKVGQEEVVVSVLQFVDDTLMFTDVTFENVLCMKRTVRSFEVILYLGIPIGTNSMKMTTWQPIIEKIIKTKLATWKQ